MELVCISRREKELHLSAKTEQEKTTLVKLIEGLYHPTEGEILVDGTPIEQLDKQSLRCNIATVMQNQSIIHSLLPKIS